MKGLFAFALVFCISMNASAGLYEFIVGYNIEAINAYLVGGGDPDAKVNGNQTAIELASIIWGAEDPMVLRLISYKEDPASTRSLKASVDARKELGSMLEKLRAAETERVIILTAIVEKLEKLDPIDQHILSLDFLADLLAAIRPGEAAHVAPQLFVQLINAVETERNRRFGTIQWTRAEFMAAILKAVPDAIASYATRAVDNELKALEIATILGSFHDFNGWQVYREVYARLAPEDPVAIFILDVVPKDCI